MYFAYSGDYAVSMNLSAYACFMLLTFLVYACINYEFLVSLGTLSYLLVFILFAFLLMTLNQSMLNGVM